MMPESQCASALCLLLRLLEMSQVRRRLVLAGGHDVVVGVAVIEFVADLDHRGHPGAIFLTPRREFVSIATVCLEHGPWAREGIVEQRDLVVDEGWVCPVDK